MSSEGVAAGLEHVDGVEVSASATKLAAMVVNPTKIHHQASFAAAASRMMRQYGWCEPLWLETTADDPGRGQARAAVQAGADLVLACGGDGTVTACADGIAGSNVPLGILPVGTGNLLARNVGLPADWRAALAVALTGTSRALDAGTVFSGAGDSGAGDSGAGDSGAGDSGPGQSRSFVVMAGLGFDARMLRDTREPLKRRLGWAAYVVSGLQHLRDWPMRVTVVADGGSPVRTRASAVVIGNVGWLRGGLPLMPDARPDDGRLDAVLLTARGVAGWLTLIAEIILRRKRAGRVRRLQFSELRLETDRSQPWELDGDYMGETTQLTVTALPRHLMLRLAPDRELPRPAGAVSIASEPAAT